jgi:predicted peroxiredoxin
MYMPLLLRMWSRNLEQYTCTWHVHVYSSRLRLHIPYNNAMYMYIAQDYDSTFFTTIECTCILLKITTPHSQQQWHVHVYSSRLRTYHCCKQCGVVILSYIHVHTIVVKNVESQSWAIYMYMAMYIAQDYDSTFFTTMTCTCI